MRADLERAVQLVRDGYSYGQAAKRVGGITRNAVAGACTRAELRTGRLPDGARMAEAVALHTEGLSHREIAKRMGHKSDGSVRIMLCRAGFYPLPPSQRPEARRVKKRRE